MKSRGVGVEFRVLLRDLKTGQEAWYTSNVADEYADNQSFWWLDGNASCDCNRMIFLHDALGWDGPDDYPCGDERVAIIRVLRDGVEQAWAVDDNRLKGRAAD